LKNFEQIKNNTKEKVNDLKSILILSFIEFKDTKKDELREIEEFIHVFYDWLEEKIHELEDEQNKFNV
jgi:uncharacterized protein YgfB (UPF0149 family)